MTKLDIQLTPEQFETKKPHLLAEGFVINGPTGTMDKNGVVIDCIWKSPVLKFQITGRGMMGREREAYSAALVRTWFAEVSSSDEKLP